MQPGNHINEYSTCFIKNILMYVCRLRPPIVDFLFPVTRPHCNFSAACIFIITFGDHMIKIFVVAAMLLSACVVVSLGQQLVLWCIIETQDSDISEFSDVVFAALDYSWDEFPVYFGVFKSLRYFSCLLRCFSCLLRSFYVYLDAFHVYLDAFHFKPFNWLNIMQ